MSEEHRIKDAVDLNDIIVNIESTLDRLESNNNAGQSLGKLFPALGDRTSIDCLNLDTELDKKKYQFIQSCEVPSEYPLLLKPETEFHPVTAQTTGLPSLSLSLISELVTCPLPGRISCPEFNSYLNDNPENYVTPCLNTAEYCDEQWGYTKRINTHFGNFLFRQDVQLEACCCDCSCDEEKDSVNLLNNVQIEYDCNEHDNSNITIARYNDYNYDCNVFEVLGHEIAYTDTTEIRLNWCTGDMRITPGLHFDVSAPATYTGEFTMLADIATGDTNCTLKLTFKTLKYEHGLLTEVTDSNRVIAISNT